MKTDLGSECERSRCQHMCRKIKLFKHQSSNNILHSHESGNWQEVTQTSLLSLLLCPYHELYPSLFLKQQHSAHSPSRNQENMSRIKFLCHELPKLSIPLPPLRTFSLFTELPKELRYDIWRLAAFVSRDVKLWIAYVPRISPRVAGQTQHPGIIQASRESRTEALRYYTQVWERCPQWCSDFEDPSDRFRNTLFINFAVDRFVFNPWRSARRSLDAFNFEPAKLHLINHCALQIEGEMDDGEFKDHALGEPLDSVCKDFFVILTFENLKELTFITFMWRDSAAPPAEHNILGELEQRNAIERFKALWRLNLLELIFNQLFHFQWMIHEEDDLSPCAPGQERFEEAVEARRGGPLLEVLLILLDNLG
jgi:hypothetical protein